MTSEIGPTVNKFLTVFSNQYDKFNPGIFKNIKHKFRYDIFFYNNH